MSRFTPASYRSVLDRAFTHVLKGGGVVPQAEDDCVIEDAIAAVAAEHYAGDAAQSVFEELLTRVEGVDRDEVASAVWALVSAHADAGFTLGAAVAMQLQGNAAALGARS